MNDRALVPLQPAVPSMSLNEMMSVGQTLAKSGFFRDAKDVSQAVAKILYGAELGIAPVSAMTGIYIVEGKPTLSATLMATLIKRSGRYDYRVRQIDDQGCSIEFFDRGQSAGVSAFTRRDAEAAGLATKNTWKAYFRNMAFARALSNGARWYCADVFGGGPVYTPEELGAEVDEEGGVIEGMAASGPVEPDELERRRFWARASELGYVPKVRAHRLFGIEERDGALSEWVARPGNSWAAARSKLELAGPYADWEAQASREPMPAADAIAALTDDGQVVDRETGEVIDAPGDEGGEIGPASLGRCSVDGCSQEATGMRLGELYCDEHLEPGEVFDADAPGHPPMPEGIRNASDFITAAFKAFGLTPTRADAYVPEWRKAKVSEYPALWAKLAGMAAETSA